MSIRLFNTLKRHKEPFEPAREGQVNIYVCGPTVYDYFHIGNARVFIVFDTVRRYFQYRGYKVKFVQNFTDIDDKMIKRAAEEKITVQELAEKYIQAYQKDVAWLGVSPADYHPRATENISGIITIISADMYVAIISEKNIFLISLSLVFANEFISFRHTKFDIRSDKNNSIRNSTVGKIVCKLIMFMPLITCSICSSVSVTSSKFIFTSGTYAGLASIIIGDIIWSGFIDVNAFKSRPIPCIS